MADWWESAPKVEADAKGDWWQAAPLARQATPIRYGGADAALSSGEPQSVISRAKDALSQAIFGSPDRQAAKDAGINLQPTTAEMGKTALAGAAAMGGGEAAGMLSAYPMVAAKMLGSSVLGTMAGGTAGHYGGKALEFAGAPAGTAEVGGKIGGFLGGLAAPIKGPAVLEAIAPHIPHGEAIAALGRFLNWREAIPAAKATMGEVLPFVAKSVEAAAPAAEVSAGGVNASLEDLLKGSLKNPGAKPPLNLVEREAALGSFPKEMASKIQGMKIDGLSNVQIARRLQNEYGQHVITLKNANFLVDQILAGVK